MQLGELIRNFSEEAVAHEALLACDDMVLFAQVSEAARGYDESVGDYASGAVRRFANFATREDWLGLMSVLERAPGPGLRVQPVVKADRDCAGAAAASVIAKVARDELMVRLHDDLPAYQWVRNKGYASPEHRAAILEHGVSDHHRLSWAFAGAPTLF